VHILSFYPPGAWAAGNMSLSTGKWKRSSSLTTEEIDAVENPKYIKDYPWKVIPAIVRVHDGSARERFGGFVYPELLLETLKKVLITGNRRYASRDVRPSSSPLSA
jgi:hypothetical protein